MLRTHALLCLLAGLLGCGTLTSRPEEKVPEGMTCAALRSAHTDGEKLSAALASAQPGDCVVVDSGTYRGAFRVPADVSLVAGDGASVVVEGDQEAAPALLIEGGPKSTIRGLRIRAALGVGILIEPGPATLIDVHMVSAGRSALMASCSGPSCETQDETLIQDSDFSQSAIGMWVMNSRVRAVNTRFGEQKAQTLSSGHGVIASAGAQLVLQGCVVENNAEVGVLIDGATTSATLENTVVKNNRGRGVWAQGLRGTAEAPSLIIQGEGTRIDSNSLVGVGLRDSIGVKLTQATVMGTLKVDVPVGLAGLEGVGDGVGLFEGSGATSATSLKLLGNHRSQLIVDTGGDGISVADSMVEGVGTQYRIVVQKTTAAVTVPTEQLSNPGRELAVSAQPLTLAQ
jgi:hypothetical protein